MKYSVVLIDDEPFNIQGFSKYVHWSDLGFNLINTFFDSRDALEYLSKYPVDLVITDIDMPFINGFEIIGKIKQLYPLTEAVVLTAYSEFEFVKTAMEHQCLSYILKTISIDEFENKLLYIKRRLDDLYQTRAMAKELTELKYYLKEKIIDNITNGVYNEETNIAAQLPFKLNIHDDKCKAYMFKIKNYDKVHISKYDSENAYNITYNLLELDGIENVEYFVSINDEITILILYDNNFPDFICDNHFKSILGDDVFISNVKKFEDIRSLFKYFSVTQNEYILNNLISDFRSFIMEKNFEYAEKKLNDIFDICEKHEISDYITIFKYMFNLVDNSYNKILDNIENLNQFKEMCTLLFDSYIKSPSQQIKDNEILIAKIIDYIKTNINKELTLKDIASKFFINYEYLSRLFKKQTGLNYKDYVLTLKMNYACELLLQSTLAINAIANAIGFKDARYFSSTFKKYKGCYPSEYRTTIADKNITE